MVVLEIYDSTEQLLSTTKKKKTYPEVPPLFITKSLRYLVLFGGATPKRRCSFGGSFMTRTIWLFWTRPRSKTVIYTPGKRGKWNKCRVIIERILNLIASCVQKIGSPIKDRVVDPRINYFVWIKLREIIIIDAAIKLVNSVLTSL